MTELLACRDIGKLYGGVVALKKIDLAVDAGEIVGLVGANGAGKSTLIDIISGNTRQSRGAVHLRGAEVRGGPAKRARAGISRTFQLPQVAHDLSLRENIACGLAAPRFRSPYRLAAEWFHSAVHDTTDWGLVEEVSRSIGLSGLERAAGTVSFGDLRLTEVARALVQQPDFIMLDEPFPGVDDDGVAGVLAALRELSAQGKGVLLVDHNVDIVASIADSLVLIAEGEVAIEGSVEDCMASQVFRHRYIGVA
ncbi:ATP-binding cassette domain-containing protein [Pseudonocardia kujensis]|uniref:ATP-binding cassette domain-containing protein n=1 Tax=Pseudonocardia kujensis TaxID=1128675 RepID=UPI001E42B71B|nr:ATP-binding cassette domain-containing protein [Pseudonocardia kujensis]MCE0765080.1 ATP-binding cassette domain-containing protein [Pseudonocardia kujensis]